MIHLSRLFLGILVLAFLSPLPSVISANPSAEIPSPAKQPHTEPDPEVYRLWYRNFDSPPILSLLTLALSKTPEYGLFTIERSVEMGQGRALLELRGRSRLIDIANVATTPDRERNLYAIPIPIDGGLLGYRVCVINKSHAHRFRGITSIDEMTDRGLRIGQGSHWPDTEILRANGAHVITHARFEQLFDMLLNERFDCFARGVSEVLFDLEVTRHDQLMIEPDLLLAYPMPSYFFVGPEDHATAQRIQLGIERAIADGSFAEFIEQFYGYPLEVLNLGDRTLIELTNPFISDEYEDQGKRTMKRLIQRLRAGQKDTP